MKRKNFALSPQEASVIRAVLVIAGNATAPEDWRLDEIITSLINRLDDTFDDTAIVHPDHR